MSWVHRYRKHSRIAPRRRLGWRRWLVVGAFSWLALAVARANAAEIERWGIFELELRGPAEGNPFVDVEVAARFSQGERSVEVSGFYDGAGVYRIRFMPEAVGEWRYETTSNRAELAGRNGTFTVTEPSPRNHGPVRVANTFHFAYADGTSFQPLGTTCYAWVHQPEEVEELTLRSLAASPFNKVRMTVFPTQGGPTGPLRSPFEGAPPDQWETTRFNPSFFRHLEQRVAQLGELGIEADLILFHPYDARSGFNTMDAASDDRYVRYLVARLAAYRNVWWSLCNEWDFLKEKTESDWDRLFQVVQAADPYGRLRSIHNGYLIYNHAQPWVTHASLQQGAAVLHPERAMIYRDVWRKPVVFDEVKYEGNHTRRWGWLSGEELVLRFWSGMIAGTYVGHGETFRSAVGAWISLGGELLGESPARIAFLKTVLADGPPEGIEPIDKWQDRRTGGKAGEYYLVYLGEQAPTEWPVVLYRTGLAEGMRFRAEVIDTWNMTITPVDGEFELQRENQYDFVDRRARAVPLPGRPYQAIRLRRLGPAPTGAVESEPEP